MAEDPLNTIAVVPIHPISPIAYWRESFMKKHFALAILAAASFASAAKYGTAGCGVGSLVFGDQKGMIQILAVTTNQYLGQTSSITTGTSNCTEDGVAMADREKALFAEANFNVIKEEMATGKGENLSVLASLYGCSGASVGSFGSAAQANYASIGGTPSALEMLDAIDGMVRSDANLSSCHSN